MRVEADPIIYFPQMTHKYPTRHKKCLKKVYNTVVPELIAAYAKPTPR